MVATGVHSQTNTGGEVVRGKYVEARTITLASGGTLGVLFIGGVPGVEEGFKHFAFGPKSAFGLVTQEVRNFLDASAKKYKWVIDTWHQIMPEHGPRILSDLAREDGKYVQSSQPFLYVEALPLADGVVTSARKLKSHAIFFTPADCFLGIAVSADGEIIIPMHVGYKPLLAGIVLGAKNIIEAAGKDLGVFYFGYGNRSPLSLRHNQEAFVAFRGKYGSDCVDDIHGTVDLALAIERQAASLGFSPILISEVDTKQLNAAGQSASHQGEIQAGKPAAETSRALVAVTIL